MLDITDVLERTIIGIENLCGKKHIHYYAYSWYSDDSSPTPYRFAEYTFFIEDLEKVLKYGITCYESEYQEYIKQYILDCSEEECRDCYIYYHAGQPPKLIRERDISLSTPCGFYILTDTPKHGEINQVVKYGDSLDMVVPPEPVKLSKLPITAFDEVEYALFDVIKQYADILGLKIITDEDNDIDFRSVKEVAETIINTFKDAGVEFE